MSKKIEINIKSWGQVTLSQFDKLDEIFKEEGLSAVEKDVALIAVLAGVDEDDVWDLTIDELGKLRMQVTWLYNFQYPKNIKFKTIKVGDYNCKVDVNLQHMTIAQYVDFQTYFKNVEKYRAELLSVFFIPKGCKYGEGYEISDLIKQIREHIDIMTFNSVCFFFLKKYQDLTRNTLISLTWRMRTMRWLMIEGNPLREKFRVVIEKLKELRHSPILGSA